MQAYVCNESFLEAISLVEKFEDPVHYAIVLRGLLQKRYHLMFEECCQKFERFNSDERVFDHVLSQLHDDEDYETLDMFYSRIGPELIPFKSRKNSDERPIWDLHLYSIGKIFIQIWGAMD